MVAPVLTLSAGVEALDLVLSASAGVVVLVPALPVPLGVDDTVVDELMVTVGGDVVTVAVTPLVAIFSLLSDSANELLIEALLFLLFVLCNLGVNLDAGCEEAID